MSYQEAINDPVILILVVLVMAVVMVIAVLFFRKSWRRAKELGFSHKELMNVVKSTATYTIVPSIAILIGLFSLGAMVGIPWGWYRLSVLGSVSYELMAADSALKALGISVANAKAADFVVVAFVMTISIMAGLVSSVFISKGIQNGQLNMKKRDQKWGALGNSTFMLTIMVVFTIPMLLQGGVTLLTLLTSALITVGLSMIAKATKAKWLNEFVLAISLVVSMASSILWTNLLR
ncbi:MAG: DUF5058 family protein [Rectinema sp.]